VTRYQLTLAVPAILTLHNLEEALTFQRWLPVIQTRVPFGLQAWFDDISPGTLHIALVVATAVPWAVALWSARRPSSALASWFVLLVQAVVLLNVFWHLFVAGVLLRGYSPGLLTAVTLNLPFSMYLFTRATQEGWCSRGAAIALIPAALLVHGPLLVGLPYFMYVDTQSDALGSLLLCCAKHLH
jgi:hypothetical protein